jgi:hypothetical protein
MGHPSGSKGNAFRVKHSFDEAYEHVGPKGISFISTTGEQIHATTGYSKDGTTKTIVFMGERTRHGSAYNACWGYRSDCSGSRIGQCAEALDQSF